jgi:hypothetical protein
MVHSNNYEGGLNEIAICKGVGRLKRNHPRMVKQLYWFGCEVASRGSG